MLDISTLPSTWNSYYEGKVGLSKNPITIHPKADSFSFTPINDSPDWESLDLQKVTTCGYSIITFQAQSYPIARLAYMLKFEPVESKDFTDFISFTRYIDFPVIREIPALIDAEFNITQNLQSYAKAKCEEAAIEDKVSRNAPEELDFKIMMQNNKLGRDGQRDYFQGNIFLSDEFLLVQ